MSEDLFWLIFWHVYAGIFGWYVIKKIQKFRKIVRENKESCKVLACEIAKDAAKDVSLYVLLPFGIRKAAKKISEKKRNKK